MKKTLLILLLGLGLVGFEARADVKLMRLIKETEGLLSALPAKDEARGPISLRLADLLFEEIIDLLKNPLPSSAEEKVLEGYRTRAIGLYTAALQASPSPKQEQRAKINFQLARIFTDMGETARAAKLWAEVHALTSIPEIKREAALRLAENFEHQSSISERNKAEPYFKEAISLCSNGPSCAYAKYRYAWYLHNASRSAEAVATIKETLFDDQGRVRDESVRDWIIMLGRSTSTLVEVKNQEEGKVAFNEVKAVADRLGRPELIKQLSDSFYSAGNKAAGTWVLAQVDGSGEDAFVKVRLLEEFYGYRKWADFTTKLTQLQSMALATQGRDLFSKKEDAAEAERILKRLSVQLDGERQTDSTKTESFTRLVSTYLEVFPFTPERPRMVDGWLNAEKSNGARVQQLKRWSEQLSTKRPGSFSEEIRMRELRAEAAQNEKRFDIVIEEMQALQGILGSKEYAQTQGKAKAAIASGLRKYLYLEARAHYSNQSLDVALNGFKELAKVNVSSLNPGGVIDEWAIQSQNLALDIYGSRKDFAGVQAQVGTWTLNPRVVAAARADAKLGKEINEMAVVGTKAQFEEANARGNDPGALTVFLNNCEARILETQSCQNAKVLAHRLKDESALLKILKWTAERDQRPESYSNYISELEAAGFFAESAEVWIAFNAKNKKNITLKEGLRVALLFELGGKFKERDTWLKQTLKNPNPVDLKANEGLVALTLKDADLLSPMAGTLAFSEEFKVRVANELELANPGKFPWARKALLAAKVYPGEAWTRLILADLLPRVEQASRINITGRDSRRQFEKRFQILKNLSKAAKSALEVADSATRVQIATLVEIANRQMKKAILGSPIPAEAQGEARAQLEAALASLSEPFRNEEEQAQKLAQDQLAGITNPDQKATIQKWVTEVTSASEGDKVMLSQAAAQSVRKVESRTEVLRAIQGRAEVKAALNALRTSPESRESVQNLFQVYQAEGFSRLASYFKGRLDGASAEIKEETKHE